MNDFLAFWGKARPTTGEGPRWHPNAYHSLDVAAAAEALLAAGVTRPPSPWQARGHEAAIVALIALHDLGKFSRPFQAKAEAHWPAQLGPLSAPPGPGHGVVGHAMLTDRFDDLLDPILPGWLPSARAPLIGAICGHHGRPVDECDSVSPRVVCAACQRAVRAFAAEALAVLHPAGLPAPSDDPDPALAWWLAGLTVLADWIGSAEAWFPYRAPEYDLSRYWREIARPQAARAVAAAGLTPAAVRARLTLADLLADATVTPSPVQALADSLDLGAAGPLAVLVEDQTGSGKTEAALLLAHRLMAAGRAEGVFVALPTMATANAMYDRLAAAWRRLFAKDARPSLVLAHGRRDDHPGFQNSILADAAIAGTAADDPADEPASAQCAAWLADDRRRAFMAHVGVGTIDQALLAVLPTRHAPLRLHGLHRRVLIVDEAHAYDAYMREELRRLVTFQAGLGGSTIILSATLPQRVRAGLAGAFAAGRDITAPQLAGQAYPLVTVLRDDATEEHPCPGREGLARSVAVTRLAGVDEALERVVAAARAGAAVAWVRNAVDDAAEAHAALAARGVAATLFHARFAMGDRQTIESDVLSRFGRKPGQPRAGVVVATQVIEQSLDLDFDLMVTDLAPIDLLIQRAGRVWRHARDARPVPGPTLLVLAPEPVAAPGADWLGPALRRTGRVYQDHALLWRSASVLFAAGAIVAPGDVRRLVEATYAPDGEVPQGLQRRAAEAEGRDSAALSLARQNLLSWRDGYHLNAGAWASDVRTPTRLGEQGTPVRLARWEGGVLRPWYERVGPARAWALSELMLPPWVGSGVPQAAGALAAAEAAVRRDWDAWAQDIPILPLTPAGRDEWRGTILRDNRPRAVSYTASAGLRVEMPQGE
jgi:CRISPR-associated endonuclease/helicase Cas3